MPKSAASGLRVGRFAFLDVLRGAACLAVVFFHAGIEVTKCSPHLASKLWLKACSLGYLGVPMFFVISGYCIANAACLNVTNVAGSWKFLAGRFRRIFPPCWLSLLSYLFVKLIISSSLLGGHFRFDAAPLSEFVNQNFAYYFSNVTLTQFILGRGFISSVCWTLCYEVAFYCVVFCAMLFAQRKMSFLLNLLHGITLASVAFAILAPAWISYPFDLWPQFGMGVLVYDLATRKSSRWPQVFGFATALCVFGIAYFNKLEGTGRANQATLIAALASALLISLMRQMDHQVSGTLPARMLAGIGRVSYSLYLIHYSVIAMVVKLIGQDLIAQFPLVALFALAAISLMVTPLFFQLCEQPFLTSRWKLRDARLATICGRFFRSYSAGWLNYR